jgi:hypothetical protein
MKKKIPKNGWLIKPFDMHFSLCNVEPSAQFIWWEFKTSVEDSWNEICWQVGLKSSFEFIAKRIHCKVNISFNKFICLKFIRVHSMHWQFSDKRPIPDHWWYSRSMKATSLYRHKLLGLFDRKHPKLLRFQSAQSCSVQIWQTKAAVKNEILENSFAIHESLSTYASFVMLK